MIKQKVKVNFSHTKNVIFNKLKRFKFSYLIYSSLIYLVLTISFVSISRIYLAKSNNLPASSQSQQESKNVFSKKVFSDGDFEMELKDNYLIEDTIRDDMHQWNFKKYNRINFSIVKFKNTNSTTTLLTERYFLNYLQKNTKKYDAVTYRKSAYFGNGHLFVSFKPTSFSTIDSKSLSYFEVYATLLNNYTYAFTRYDGDSDLPHYLSYTTKFTQFAAQNSNCEYRLPEGLFVESSFSDGINNAVVIAYPSTTDALGNTRDINIKDAKILFYDIQRCRLKGSFDNTKIKYEDIDRIDSVEIHKNLEILITYHRTSIVDYRKQTIRRITISNLADEWIDVQY